ncbi:isochorismatase family protein [Nocardia sp. CS682]|uniref:isochorismatase family protein n=1 Tax=Nocardia sp. CS682 TaxID=1047172 RepID=UPI0010750EB8|nr:isochorismatase family protein [Nocardia sp. CS682]QBS39239.1 isochorismatase [Nocardia sp. CS682]
MASSESRRVTERSGEYRRSGYSARLGAGDSPAVLVIDICAAYVTEDSPLYAPVADAVRAAAEIVAQARQSGLPVIFTRVRFEPGGPDGGLFRRKVPVLRVFEAGNPLGDFLDDPAPVPGDLVITKQYASAFHATPLAALLAARRIDTLVIVGLTTSGCVRASATDALQHGFRPLVVAEACGDRNTALHEANLLDLDIKYADVLSRTAALAVLRSADSSLHDLPETASGAELA